MKNNKVKRFVSKLNGFNFLIREGVKAPTQKEKIKILHDELLFLYEYNEEELNDIFIITQLKYSKLRDNIKEICSRLAKRDYIVILEYYDNELKKYTGAAMNKRGAWRPGDKPGEPTKDGTQEIDSPKEGLFKEQILKDGKDKI